MGRTFVLLDPPGYKYAKEPGFHLKSTGDVLLKRWSGIEGSASTAPPQLYNPPGSDWVLPLPQQWEPEWQKGGSATGLGLQNYVLPKASWAFATGVTATEFEWHTRKPDGTTVAYNKGVSIPKVPSPLTSLDTCSYSAIKTASGIDLPSGMGTVAMAGLAPNGRDLGEADYHPYFQWTAYPQPDEVLIFGFADFCVVLYHDQGVLLRTPDNNKLTWEFLTRFKTDGLRQDLGNTSGNTASLFSAPAIALVNRSLLFIPVGRDHLYIHLPQSEPVRVRLRRTERGSSERMFKPGNWWIGAAPKSKISFQCQVVGYGFGTQPITVRPEDFDLTANYSATGGGPTVAPAWDVEYCFGGVQSPALATGIDADGYNYVEETTSKQRVTFAVTAAGALWVSDGVNTGGKFYTHLQSSHLGAATANGSNNYLAPQFRLFEIRFPPVLAARANSLLTLNDSQFRSWKVETTFREWDGKRLHIDLTDAGLAALTATGHDARESYPVEIWEDTNGDGTADTLRAAGWLDSPEFEEQVAEGGAYAQPVRVYRLACRGMLCRGDDLRGQWYYLPQLVDPAGAGHIEHTFVAKEVLWQCGIDVADSTKVQIAADPWTGTAVARLPPRGSGVEKKNDDPWRPKWDEARMPYAVRVGADLRGWLFVENLAGKVFYQTDTAIDIQDAGVSATPIFIIHRSYAEADAAGVPGQCYYEGASRSVQSPVANIVRVTGYDNEGEWLPSILDRDLRGITDITYANYTGEPRVAALPWDGAVDEAVASRFARVRLQRLKRRIIIWEVTVPLAPWQFSATPLLGSVCTLRNRGAYIIIGLTMRLLGRDKVETLLTLEKVPV